MNKIILNELKKVVATSINYNSQSTTILIPKTLKINNQALKKNVAYKIKLKDFILSPVDSSTLASNWNNGFIPTHKEYIIEIIDKVGNMIKVNGVAVSDNTSQIFCWLPSDGFEVIDKL